MWLERPAGVYTRHEVVLHRLDNPLITTSQAPGQSVAATYEIWEARIVYSFDAHSARWSVSTIEQNGNRRHAKTQRIQVPGRHPEIVALAEKYKPDWIPDPSKARLHLPAEDVWDECMAVTVAMTGDRPDSWPQNPYRGE